MSTPNRPPEAAQAPAPLPGRPHAPLPPRGTPAAIWGPPTWTAPAPTYASPPVVVEQEDRHLVPVRLPVDQPRLPRRQQLAVHLPTRHLVRGHLDHALPAVLAIDLHDDVEPRRPLAHPEEEGGRAAWRVRLDLDVLGAGRVGLGGGHG